MVYVLFISLLSTGQNLNPRKGSTGKRSLRQREDSGAWSDDPLLPDGFVCFFFLLKAQFLDFLLLILLNNNSSLSTFGGLFL